MKKQQGSTNNPTTILHGWSKLRTHTWEFTQNHFQIFIPFAVTQTSHNHVYIYIYIYFPVFSIAQYLTIMCIYIFFFFFFLFLGQQYN
jgi:hypothetical protein